MQRILGPLALLLLAGFAVPAAAAQEPAAKPAPAEKAAVQVYDETANPQKDVAAALVRAKKENRRVLIQWGANWCGWCNRLHGTMTGNAEVAKKLRYEYDVVHVDVGRAREPGFDKNRDFAAELGAAITSIPFLTILDAEGKAVIHQPTEPFETEVDGTKCHDPKQLVEFLTTHQAPWLDARELQAAALARARDEKKRLFLHFGAPWCGWCHRLEGWLAQPEVAVLLAKDFVDLKIDTDRTLHGAELLEKARAAAGVTEAGGIPWFLFLSADGRQLATSEGPKGNVGFPYEDAEIAHFVTMLDTARVNLTAADVEQLRASLVAHRDADKKRRAAAQPPQR